MLLLVPFLGMSQPSEKACFSVPGGFYENEFSLEIFPFYQNHHIRFTTNGNRPTAASTLYTEPLLLDESLYSSSDIYTIQISPDDLVFVPDHIGHCIVIRAAVFDENDNRISEVSTNSYFIQSLGCDTHGLPVVSLCADTLDLFDYEHGIFVPGIHFDPLDPNWTGNYYMRGDAWERPVNVEFYETDNQGVNQLAGLRTHGGNGRRFPQKSLKVFAREEYGKKRFDYRFFDGNSMESFKHLVLKPFNSGWTQSGVANHVCNEIAHNLNMESLSSRPTVLFLNGEYWGIYCIQEKPDERYLEDHLGVPEEEINLLSGWNPVLDHGTSLYYEQFRTWLSEADLSLPENYEYAYAHVDMACFIDYVSLELFIENMDWPANNIRFWQRNDGPWRWIFFDGDACLRYLAFDVFANALYTGPETWPSNNDATLFFRKFLENPVFYQQFLGRFNELLNTVFQFSVTNGYLTDIENAIALEIPGQVARFNYPQSLSKWNECIGQHRYFLRHRVDNMQERINDFVEIQEYKRVAYTVAPNPCDDHVAILFDYPQDTLVNVSLYDLTGRRIVDKDLYVADRRLELDLPECLRSGIYVLRVGNVTSKIIKH